MKRIQTFFSGNKNNNNTNTNAEVPIMLPLDGDKIDFARELATAFAANQHLSLEQFRKTFVHAEEVQKVIGSQNAQLANSHL